MDLQHNVPELNILPEIIIKSKNKKETFQPYKMGEPIEKARLKSSIINSSGTSMKNLSPIRSSNINLSPIIRSPPFSDTLKMKGYITPVRPHKLANSIITSDILITHISDDVDDKRKSIVEQNSQPEALFFPIIHKKRSNKLFFIDDEDSPRKDLVNVELNYDTPEKKIMTSTSQRLLQTQLLNMSPSDVQKMKNISFEEYLKQLSCQKVNQ